MFLLYVNDLPDAIPHPVQIKMFSEDNKFYHAHPNHDNTAIAKCLSLFLYGLIYGNCQLHHRNVYPFHLEIRIFLLCNVQ